MAKDLTTKDILYALQYLDDALERQQSGKWVMASTRAPVRPAVVTEVSASGHVFSVNERDGRQRLLWLREAA